MPDATVQRWLIQLCDPAGATELPSERLDPAQFRQLLALADEHGVTGATLFNLRRLLETEGLTRVLGPTATTADRAGLAVELESAHQGWFASVAMTLCLRERAAEVVAAFRRERVPVAMIKGEDFADRLYGQASLRPFRDIDLMLPRDVIDSTASLMSDLGYRFMVPDGNYNENYGERTWDSRGAPRSRVELHWNLINCPSQRRVSSLAFEELQWEETTAPGQPTHRATPAAMLLIASVHAVVSHRFDRLQHLCDIRQICRGEAGDLDDDWLKEAAGRNGVVAALGGALDVAGRLLRDSACPAVLERLRLPVARTAWRCLVSQGTLLCPNTRLNKLRRTALREWMKRAA